MDRRRPRAVCEYRPEFKFTNALKCLIRVICLFSIFLHVISVIYSHSQFKCRLFCPHGLLDNQADTNRPINIILRSLSAAQHVLFGFFYLTVIRTMRSGFGRICWDKDCSRALKGPFTINHVAQHGVLCKWLTVYGADWQFAQSVA
jgi:hypothetical protein